MSAEWGDWVVAVKKDGDKKAKLLGSKGRITGLRIHAVRFTEANARTAAADLARVNKGYTFTAKEIR